MKTPEYQECAECKSKFKSKRNRNFSYWKWEEKYFCSENCCMAYVDRKNEKGVTKQLSR